MAEDPKNLDTTQTVHDNSDGTPPAANNTPLNDSSVPKVDLSDGSSALDALLISKGGDPRNPDGTPLKTEEEIAAEKLSDEEKATAEQKRLDDEKAAEAAKKSGTESPVDDGKEKTKTAPVAGEEPADKLKEVQLPPHSKPESVSAFKKVKELARAELAAVRGEVEELKKKIPAEGSPLPVETKKELDELRAFRAAHDAQNSPEFKAAYETPITANNESILAKLKAAGYTDEHLAKIKAIGVDKLDWEPVLKALPTVARRAIEAKLLENETILEKRAAAVTAAEKNPGEYAAKQKAAADAASVQENAEFTGTIDTILDKVEWSKQKTIPATATAVEKAAIETHNAFAKAQADRRAVLLADNSPKMRGTLVASTLLAYQFKDQLASMTARAESAEAELAKIKKSSSPARRGSNAPSTGLPEKKGGPLQTGREALAELEAKSKGRD